MQFREAMLGCRANLPDFNNLFAARFPKLPIMTVHDGGDPMMITVELSESISKADEKILLAFCQGLEAIVALWQVAVVPRPSTPPANEPPLQIPDAISDPLAVRATRWRPHVPEYARHDEAFWFDNIDKIYAA